MVVSTRIVLSLLGVLGAIQAGVYYNLTDRYSASYAYPAFACIVFLAFAVGWMVGGLVGKGLVRGFKRVERAAQTRSAGELTVAAMIFSIASSVTAMTGPLLAPHCAETSDVSAQYAECAAYA